MRTLQNLMGGCEIFSLSMGRIYFKALRRMAVFLLFSMDYDALNVGVA